VVTTLTARYVRIPSGYMGQIIEWPEVVSEGVDLEDCRASLRDALDEMVRAYRELDKDVPAEHALLEPIAIESV